MTMEHLPDPVLSASANQIQIDEGTGPHGPGIAYVDTVGVPTVGYGYNINEPAHQARLEELGYNVSDVLAGRQEIAPAHVQQLFQESMTQAVQDASNYLPDLASYPAPVQEVVVNMAFNLGEDRLSQFVDLREALVSRDYEAAAREMVDSAWYSQVGDRGERLVDQMQAVSSQEAPVQQGQFANTQLSDPFAVATPSVFEPQNGIAETMANAMGPQPTVEFSPGPFEATGPNGATGGFLGSADPVAPSAPVESAPSHESSGAVSSGSTGSSWGGSDSGGSGSNSGGSNSDAGSSSSSGGSSGGSDSGGGGGGGPD